LDQIHVRGQRGLFAPWFMTERREKIEGIFEPSLLTSGGEIAGRNSSLSNKKKEEEKRRLEEKER